MSKTRTEKKEPKIIDTKVLYRSCDLPPCKGDCFKCMAFTLGCQRKHISEGLK